MKGWFTLNKRRFVLPIISVLAILVLFISQGMVEADTQDYDWEPIDVEDVSDVVALWVEENVENRGVYVLPAGDVRYLLVAWGEKPTGGYTMNINHVSPTMLGDIQVRVTLEAPDPDDMVTEALTYPYVLIAMEPGTETIIVNFMGDSWLGRALGEPSDDDPEIILKGMDVDPVSNPVVVWGRARVFEGTFNLVVEDGHFHLSEDVISVAGGPEWAEFALVVTYGAYSSDSGMVIASLEDAADGTVREVARVPITFDSVSLPFVDIRGHWAEASIRRGIASRFIHGYPDGTFRPEGTVSRAEFLKMLVAAETGNNLSEDVSSLPVGIRNHWVAQYLVWAVDEGWVLEEDLDLFLSPDHIIPRQEMAWLASRAAGLDPVETTLQFTDAEDIDELYTSWVAAVVKEGLLLGDPDGKFRPQSGLKRSEAVEVVWRGLHRDEPTMTEPLTFHYSFDQDAEGWTGDFTDLPVDYEADIYELEFGHSPLPEELGEHGKALRISGINRSDDLFMYVKKHLASADAIEPNTTYRIVFEVEFATNAPAGAVGVGGPPGEAVWVKVGAADVEPIPVAELDMGDDYYYLLNVDKGRQNEDGQNALRIGDVAKVEDDSFDLYELKTLDNKTKPLEISSDAQGNLWIFVGTDSGFEGRTTLYYNRIQVVLEKVQ